MGGCGFVFKSSSAVKKPPLRAGAGDKCYKIALLLRLSYVAASHRKWVLPKSLWLCDICQSPCTSALHILKPIFECLHKAAAAGCPMFKTHKSSVQQPVLLSTNAHCCLPKPLFLARTAPKYGKVYLLTYSLQSSLSTSR